jgi:biotin synthase
VSDSCSRLAERALRDEPPSAADALRILEGDGFELLPLLHAAFVPREHHFGRKVMVHVLNNIQNGLCPEDCGYCSQSRDSDAAIRKYPLKSEEEILAEAEQAARAGASRYCMVASGRGPTLERTRQLARIVRKVKERHPIEVCLSVGLLEEEHARILAEAGLDRLNHNLNTSASHYERICTTHIEPCSGLIVGMGETGSDVVEVAFRLRELEVPSIPVNFLIPIEGNPVLSDDSLTPERCLRALALMRLVNPRAEIRVAAGREGHLRALQPLALWPANSLFVEGYLTTRGDAVDDTYRMIRDAGFEVEGNAQSERAGLQTDPARGRFRLSGADGEILRPEVARAD